MTAGGGSTFIPRLSVDGFILASIISRNKESCVTAGRRWTEGSTVKWGPERGTVTRVTVFQGSKTCGLYWSLVAENERQQREFKGMMDRM